MQFILKLLTVAQSAIAIELVAENLLQLTATYDTSYELDDPHVIISGTNPTSSYNAGTYWGNVYPA